VIKAAFEPEARSELRQSARWYNSRRSGLGLEFLAEIRRSLDAILESPGRWPMLTKASRRYRLDRFPYWIVYQEKDDYIRILAIAHQSRRPGYWRKRERLK
jgi:plasmid stabilization system protein ParE